jgi:ubiquitin C-terminal hydrolase
MMPPPDPNYNKYELYGVVIHRGSAHRGHYLCFARDLLHETDWQGGLA